jgi:hypothetical protein
LELKAPAVPESERIVHFDVTGFSEGHVYTLTQEYVKPLVLAQLNDRARPLFYTEERGTALAGRIDKDRGIVSFSGVLDNSAVGQAKDYTFNIVDETSGARFTRTVKGKTVSKDMAIGLGSLRDASTWTAIAQPAITLEQSSLEMSGSMQKVPGFVSYTLDYPIAGESLTATPSASWIKITGITDTEVNFYAEGNSTGGIRKGTITLGYKNAQSQVFTITQHAWLDRFTIIEVAEHEKEISHDGGAFPLDYSITHPYPECTITFEYNTSDKDVAPNVTFKVKVVEKHSVVLDENSTTAPTAAANVNVMVKRTINAGEWSTIVLPFAMTETQVKAAFGNDVELADFTGYETTEDGDNNIVGITINFNDNVTAIEANHPYIIKVSSAITEFTVADVDIAPEADPSVSFGYTTGSKPKVYHPRDFNGTFVADFDFYNAATSYPLFLSGNKIYYATLSTQHMKAFRAYFDFDAVLAEVENASARITMAFDDSGTTGISTIGYKTNDGEYYNLQGMPVEKPTRGLYIHNGRKVIIK